MATLWLLYGSGVVGIDAMWSLAWGRDIAHLHALSESGTTTPHVLSNLLGAALSPLGAEADRGLIAVTYIGAAVLVWCVALVAWRLAGRRAAALALLLMATREQLLFATFGAFLDVLNAMLVAGAALAVVGATRERWRASAALLALAGLLRPEPWLLLAVTTLWRKRETGAFDRVLLALTFVVPACWAGADFLLTSDAMFSLHETRRVVEAFAGGHDPNFWRLLAGIPKSVVRTPGVEVVLVALATMLLMRRGAAARRQRWLGAAPDAPATRRGVTLLAGGATVLALALTAQALSGTLLFARFSLPIAALLVPIAAAAIVWALDARGAHWIAAPAAAGFLLILVATPLLWHARVTTAPERAQYEAARHEVRAGERCEPFVVPGRTLRVFIAAWSDKPAGVVHAAATDGIPTTGTYFDATSAEAEAWALHPNFPQRRLTATNAPVVEAGEGWLVRARCP